MAAEENLLIIQRSVLYYVQLLTHSASHFFFGRHKTGSKLIYPATVISYL